VPLAEEATGRTGTEACSVVTDHLPAWLAVDLYGSRGNRAQGPQQDNSKKRIAAGA